MTPPSKSVQRRLAVQRRDPRPVSEAAVLKAVKQLLEARGFRVFRRTVLAVHAEHKGKKRFVRAGEPGMADLYGWHRHGLLKASENADCIAGRHIEVEVKALGGKLTFAQKVWLDLADDAGCIAFWCDSTEMCQAKLKEWGL